MQGACSWTKKIETLSRKSSKCHRQLVFPKFKSKDIKRTDSETLEWKNENKKNRVM